jgi:uridine phosphorylase
MTTATANRPLTSSGKQYHINAGPGDLARYVLLPGDPNRGIAIAEDLWGVPYKLISEQRGNKVIRGKYNGVDISSCATGMGPSSTAIILRELANIGCDTLIRIGTCGSFREQIHAGDLVVLNGAIRKYDGLTGLYAPPDFEAAADKRIVDVLTLSGQKCGLTLGKNLHVGRSCTTNDYFIGQGRPWGDEKEMTPYMTEQMKKRFKDVTENTDALIFEMEASVIFTHARLLRLRAGGICLVVADRVRNEFLSTEEMYDGEKIMGKVACGAVELLYKSDSSLKK